MHDFHRVYANSGGALEKKRQRSEFFNGIYHNAHLLWKIPSCARLMRVDPHSAIDQWIGMLKWHLSTGSREGNAECENSQGILRLVLCKNLRRKRRYFVNRFHYFHEKSFGIPHLHGVIIFPQVLL